MTQPTPTQAAWKIRQFLENLRSDCPGTTHITGLTGIQDNSLRLEYLDALAAEIPTVLDLADPRGRPTCDACDNEHPVLNMDPTAQLELYRNVFNNAGTLAPADLDDLLTWMSCVIDRYRDTAIQLDVARRQHQVDSDDEAEVYYAIRDRHGDIGELPNLEAAVYQYDHMVKEAQRLRFTEAELGAQIVVSEVRTTKSLWQPVDAKTLRDVRARRNDPWRDKPSAVQTSVPE